MSSLFTNLFLVLLLILLPKVASAEIATTKDWIGLFAVGAGDNKSSAVATNANATFIDGKTWVYTSSCTQTAGTTPKLSDSTGCNLTPSTLPPAGNYELRMYAYDGQDAEALLAKSPIAATPPSPAPGGNCPPQVVNPRVRDGLISAISSSNFGNPTGTCVISGSAPFATFAMDNFLALKSTFFDQAKDNPTKLINKNITPIVGEATQDNIPMGTTLPFEDQLYTINGNLTIASEPNGNRSGIVFVQGNLTISDTQFTYGTNTSGIIFVVSGNVIIDPTVTRIDAVIIAEGKIYTAGASCSHSTAVTAPQLVVNGSLVALNDSNSIEFCRTLATTNNTTPAEQINNQPKYLVILRDLYSSTLQKWSEIQ